MIAQVNDPFILPSTRLQAAPLYQTLGRRIFDQFDWWQYFGLEIKRAPDFPWSLDELMAPCPIYPGYRIAETHFAFLGVSAFNGRPLTIQHWREIAGDQFYIGDEFSCRFNGGRAWYEEQIFANKPTCAARWYLVPILSPTLPLPSRATNNPFTVLPKKYTPISTVEMATAFLLFQQKQEHLPWQDKLLYTSDECWFYTKTCVGSRDGKIWIGTCQKDDASSQLGMALQCLP